MTQPARIKRSYIGFTGVERSPWRDRLKDLARAMLVVFATLVITQIVVTALLSRTT